MAAPTEGEGSRARAGGGGVYYTFGGTSGGGSSGGAGRPWGELVDRAAFGKPDSTRDAFSRIKKNLSYFRRNYAIMMLVIVGLALLWHPISLIVLAVLTAAWIYLYFSRSGPLVLFNRSFGENLVLAILIVVTIVALAFTPNAAYTSPPIVALDVLNALLLTAQHWQAVSMQNFALASLLQRRSNWDCVEPTSISSLCADELLPCFTLVCTRMSLYVLREG